MQLISRDGYALPPPPLFPRSVDTKEIYNSPKGHRSEILLITFLNSLGAGRRTAEYACMAPGMPFLSENKSFGIFRSSRRSERNILFTFNKGEFSSKYDIFSRRTFPGERTSRDKYA
ncbi:hypothetical protein GWI33_007455 [Rhynchophorus ferrugineus]|uniref:Uncharacterized protein n=1 Tax=Rhynchophorus ferrugineus TaxID=354439 RepID=A0A834IIT6_RHYFE|nr:hypothetical protein GWI33_007455 [Rhynchophorus ferrugineus]